MAVDDELDDDEPDVPDVPDVPDEGVEVVVEVDGLELVSDDVVDPASFLVSPEPPAAGVGEVLADARESVL